MSSAGEFSSPEPAGEDSAQDADAKALLDLYRDLAAERALEIAELTRRLRLNHRERKRASRAARWQRAKQRTRRVARAVLVLPSRGARWISRQPRTGRFFRRSTAWVRGRALAWRRDIGRTRPVRIVMTRFRRFQNRHVIPPVWVGDVLVPPRFRELDYASLVGRLARARPVCVLIPVYGGATETKECVESVLRWTPESVRVIILDDASPDQATRDVLAKVEAETRVEVIRREHNLGYTVNANRGMEMVPASDVVLLNSDTVVGPLWLQRLRWAAYASDRTGAVSAVSDNAGSMSVPGPGAHNDWSTPWGWPNAARAMAAAAPTFRFDAPTAHGFCLYLRREALDDIGLFDEISFPRGYGEENDWSVRAVARGWTVALAPHALVRHRRSRSFGASRAELVAAATVTMEALHPGYSRRVKAWSRSAEWRLLTDRATVARDAAASTRYRRRLLSVIHVAGGGTPQTNRELLEALSGDQDAFVVAANPAFVELHEVTPRGWRLIETWHPRPEFRLDDEWRLDYASWLTRWLIDLGIEAIHIRHLINQPLDTLPQVAQALDIPVILSTHDFYMVCPTVNLIDGEGTFCGGVCTPSTTRCVLPTGFIAQAQDLKHHGVFDWRRRSSAALQSARVVVATSESAAEVHARTMPEIAERLVVIEHGRPFAASTEPTWRRGADRTPGPLRILCTANWNLQKGTQYLPQIVALTSPLVEWHIAGRGSERIGPGVISYGEYTQASLEDLIAEIDPDLAGIFSIAPETYSQTLSEAWGFGLPVVATDLGAVADRIRRHGGGILVAPLDAERAASEIADIARRVLRGEDHGVPRPSEGSVRSLHDMAADYNALYMGGSRQVHVAVLPADGIGSVHVRLRSRASRLADDPRVRFTELSPIDLDESNYAWPIDVLVLQRDALLRLSPAAADVLLARRPTRIVVELDDDLVAASREGRIAPERGEAVLRALSLADAVIVSTAFLAHVIAEYTTAPIEVHENLVDEFAWGSVPTYLTPDVSVSRRWVYWGTDTHAEDLDLLRDAFTASAQEHGRHQLDVIGVTERRADWFNAIPVPAGRSGYEQFGQWLRAMAHERRWYGGLAPLVDTPFTRAKSDLKALEYAMTGLPSLLADVEPYRGLAARGGTLVPPTPESWREAIDRASRDPQWHENGRTLIDHVREARTLEAVNALDAWVRAIVGESR